MKLVSAGHAVLRALAQPVPSHRNLKEWKAFEMSMYRLMNEQDGIGLAAPQVNSSHRVFLLDESIFSNDDETETPMSYRAIYNPVIHQVQGPVVYDLEGCLSIPGINGFVPRYTSINMSYENTAGERIEHEMLHDWSARVFQHELDHLNGIVFTDRVLRETIKSTTEYAENESYYRDLYARYNDVN